MKNNRREERISDIDLPRRVAAAATSAEGAPPLFLTGREFSPRADGRDGLPPLPWDVFVAACGFARADDSSDSAFAARVVSLAARAPRLLRRRDAAIDHTAGARLPATAARAASDLAPVLRELDARFFAPADDDATIDRNLRAAAQTARAQIEDPDDEKLFAAWLAAASRADYPARRVARGLARFCQGNRRAIVFVGGEPEDDPPFARAFFDLIEASGAPLLIARPPRAARESFLRELWREEFDPPAPSALAPTPWGGCDWRFARAQSLVGAAEAALAAIEEMPPDARVAAVALDRALARRFRARAAARGIVLRDVAGWRASTLVVGEAVLRFAAAAFAVDARADFEAMIKTGGFFSPLDADRQRAALRCLADGGADGADDLATARRLFEMERKNAPRGKRALADFLDWILAAAKRETIGGWFARDEAGRVVLRGLRACRRAARQAGGDDLAGDDFVSWLANFLERLFAPVDAAAAKPARAVFTSLARASFADFDAIVLLGADARFLPDLSAPPLSDSARRALGLRTRAARLAATRAALARALGRHARVVFVAQTTGDAGETISESPFVVVAREAMTAAGVPVRRLSSPPPPAPAPGLSPPAPARAFCPPPPTLSPRGADDLQSCPYLFFARRILRLRETDDGDDFSRLRLGSMMHEILRDFGRQTDGRAADDGEWRDILRRASEDGFRGKPAAANLEKSRWFGKIESFAQKESKRRREGWRFVAAEEEVARDLSDTPAPLRLRGRIDRIEENDDKQRALIDYKSGATPTSKTRMQNGEAPQLPLYAFMRRTPNARLRLVYPLAGDPGRAVEIQDPALPKKCARRAQEIFAALARGAALPANGAPTTCRSCEARGLCRKDHWQIPPAGEDSPAESNATARN